MLKFRSLESIFFTAKVIFEIITPETRYKQSFGKIRKSILLDPNFQSMGIWAQNFPKPMSDLKLSPSKYNFEFVSVLNKYNQ